MALVSELSTVLSHQRAATEKSTDYLHSSAAVVQGATIPSHKPTFPKTAAIAMTVLLGSCHPAPLPKEKASTLTLRPTKTETVVPTETEIVRFTSVFSALPEFSPVFSTEQIQTYVIHSEDIYYHVDSSRIAKATNAQQVLLQASHTASKNPEDFRHLPTRQKLFPLFKYVIGTTLVVGVLSEVNGENDTPAVFLDLHTFAPDDSPIDFAVIFTRLYFETYLAEDFIIESSHREISIVQTDTNWFEYSNNGDVVGKLRTPEVSTSESRIRIAKDGYIQVSAIEPLKP